MGTAIPLKTSTSVRKPKADDTKLRQEIIARLDKFFGQGVYQVDFAKARGGRLGALVTYTDFLSEHLAGQMLADIIPSEVHVVLKREYSDRAISQILLDEYKKNKVAIVDCYGGELRPETVRAFVCRKLDGVEMIG